MSTLVITNAASMYSYDVIASLVEGFRDAALSTVYRSSRAISHIISKSSPPRSGKWKPSERTRYLKS
jgi:hypothetical protein